MALNPLAYTEKIVQSFLRYQLTTYPFADPRLHAQMRALLSLETARQTPLLKGPFVSLSRAFQAGTRIESLIDEGLLHPHMQQIIPFASVYGHQEEGIRAICGGRTTLISTGTGSGKRECFLYPIISRCLELRDQGASAGICAVIVYPMNALAEDQLGRLRELLAGRGIPFGMYVGKPPTDEAEVTGVRLDPGASNADSRAALRQAREQGEGVSVHPPEEVCSRQVMRTRGRQPRILLTNVKQLELLLARQSDVELFDQARLDFLVFDEAHTFTGAQGSETACLVRRLRSFCGRDAGQTVCVATSATIVDQDHPDAARDFASRFFGVGRDQVATVSEVYEEEVWAAARAVPAPPDDPIARLREVLTAVDAPAPEAAVRDAWRHLTGEDLPPGDWETALHEALSASELLYQAAQLLEKPRVLADLLDELGAAIGRPVGEEELILWLTLGAAARLQGRPLLRPVVHGFLRGVSGAVVTFEDTGNTPILHLSAEEEEDSQDQLRLRVSTCTTCGQHYFEHALADFEYTGRVPGGGAAQSDGVCWEALDPARGGMRVLLLDRLISAEEGEGDDDHPKLSPLFLCRHCGAAHPASGDRCLACGQAGSFVVLQVVQQRADRPGLLYTCLCCGAHGRGGAGRFREPIKPVRATNVADVHILAQDMIHHAERRRLLVFADNRQDAAFPAGWMRDHARRFRLRSLIARELEARPLSLGDLTHYLDSILEKDDALSMALLPEVWAVAPKEAGGVVHREERRYLLRLLLLREITMSAKQQIGLEPWGRLKVQYIGLDETRPFVRPWSGRLGLPMDALVGGIAAVLDMERRRRLLLDRTGRLFSRIWAPGARNVPPLPANYWQRAGRAGRRHRMAVNLTYCRGVSHDRAYFTEPLKILEGRIDPPAFNLANELMIAKHVHATVLTRLHQLARQGSSLPAAEREPIVQALRTAFPPLIREYLFSPEGEIRFQPLDIRVLQGVITRHRAAIEAAVSAAFQQGWPAADGPVVTGEKLAGHVLGMTGELETVIQRLHRRLHWALNQMAQLEQLRRRIGALDEEQQSFYDRCRRLVRRLKGTDRRQRRQAEGVDDIATYNVLAAEGFLPGYGLDTGAILGMAEVPRWVRGMDDFDLPRPPGMALREYMIDDNYGRGASFLFCSHE